MLTAGFRNLNSVVGTIGRRACRGTVTTSKQSIIFSCRLIALRGTEKYDSNPLLSLPRDIFWSDVMTTFMFGESSILYSKLGPFVRKLSLRNN